jgi:hypothetical protein
VIDDDDDDDELELECGAVGGMIGRGNRTNRSKLASVPLRPPQIPHDLTKALTQADMLESHRLTA